MYTGCPSDRYYCGTYGPGYLQGGHPGPNEGKVSRTVCFASSSGCSCSWTNSINVINCAGLYYVYELNGVPGCDMRYCSGG